MSKTIAEIMGLVDAHKDAQAGREYGKLPKTRKAIEARISSEFDQHMQELRAYEVTVANRDARIAELEKQLAAVQQGVQRIQANCYSDNDGDYWHDRPDDCVFVEGLKVGETFELQASVRAWSETFRVTKAPDDTSDEYEVELVSTNAPISATHPTQQVAGVPWENFPSYLIDHCEGDTITEEGLQRALSAMLQNPQYATQAKQGAE